MLAFDILFCVFCVQAWQFSIASASVEYVTVSTKLGRVRGAVKQLDDGKKVNQFFRIPYAKPPIGDLRWKETVPAENWEDVLDASKLYPPHCPQIQFPSSEEMKVKFYIPGPMNEDCLYLNIFAPSYATPQSKLSVVVAIHGGGFTAGTAMNGDGTLVAALTDVIVVSINYRLGVLGFAPFPGTESKGNYGMFDQVMALKWIKENIEEFGGNPESITIFGCSAGGASVSLLTLSPLSKGLFQRAISESGAAVAFWGGSESQNFSFLEDLGSFLNCSEGLEDLKTCLKDKTVDEILKGQENITMKHMLSLIPRVDGKFLPEHPLKLLEKGHVHDVEQIIGVNEHEGDMMIYIMNMTSVPLNMLVDIFAKSEHQIVKDAIIQEYTVYGSEVSETEKIHKTADFIHSYMFGAPADLQARLVSKTGKSVYYYQYAHRNKFTVYPDWVRVSHGDEVAYTIGVPMNISGQTIYTAEGFTEMEKGLSMTMMKMWSNFAKTGNPSVPEDGIEWPKFTEQDPVYLKISLQPEVKRNLRPKEMAFWNEYLPKIKQQLKAQETQPPKEKQSDKDEL